MSTPGHEPHAYPQFYNWDKGEYDVVCFDQTRREFWVPPHSTYITREYALMLVTLGFKHAASESTMKELKKCSEPSSD